MKLLFREKHLSIDSFDTVELPDFTVLTGYNGSGKSHLLQAIQNRKVVIEGFENSNIVYFNYETFKLENEANYTGQQLYSDRENGWNFFHNNVRPTIISWKNNLGDSYQNFVVKCEEKNKPLWELSRSDIGDETSWQLLHQYKENIKNLFSNSYKNNVQAEGLLTLIKKLKRSVDELDREEFFVLFRPYTYKEDFLPQQLGKIIWDYYIKLRNNQVNRYENEKNGASLPVTTDDEFIKKYGEKPWDVINQILQKFNHLEYRVSSPEGIDVFTSYQLRLLHTKKDGVRVDFSNLSSGERILMALVASIYKSLSDNHFPDVLLLDEIDASLHPSMINNLLEVVRDIFLKKEIKVILVTHSPTTVALTEEESLYVVNREGSKKVQKKSKEEAIDILTEGFITLDKGVKIFDQISISKVSVITEGKNIEYIKKAFEFYSIENVELITGAEDRTGKDQLKILYDFLSKIPHDKIILFVWDCDADKYKSLPEINNTVPFVFDVNHSNTIAKKGIENLFSENLFDSFKVTITPSQGSGRVEFDENRKSDFGTFVLSRNDHADFNNFKPLINKIKSLL